LSVALNGDERWNAAGRPDVTATAEAADDFTVAGALLRTELGATVCLVVAAAGVDLAVDTNLRDDDEAARELTRSGVAGAGLAVAGFVCLEPVGGAAGRLEPPADLTPPGWIPLPRGSLLDSLDLFTSVVTADDDVSDGGRHCTSSSTDST